MLYSVVFEQGKCGLHWDVHKMIEDASLVGRLGAEVLDFLLLAQINGNS